jgi:TetR/AcrR family transcriptional repressor of nem operon
MKQKILEIAKDYIQKVGFDNFSFRDIASSIGIKSSSIHYHFPSKNDLAIALIEEEIKALEHLFDLPLEKRIEAFINLFQLQLENKKWCLCGMLSIRLIDKSVTDKTNYFFDQCMQLLLPCLKDEQEVKELIALCEGGLLLFRNNSNSLFFKNLKKRFS